MADDAENWLKIQKSIEDFENKWTETLTETLTELRDTFSDMTAAHLALIKRVEALETAAQKRGKVVSLPGGKA